MGQICWFFILEFYGKGNIESHFSTAVVQQKHRWFNLHPPWIMKFPDTQNGHIQYRLMGLVDFTLQFAGRFLSNLCSLNNSIYGILWHHIWLAACLRRWGFSMMEIPNVEISPTTSEQKQRRQTSTEVSKIKVFLQRVEQKKLPNHTKSKNIETKNNNIHIIKKNMFYM